MFKKLATGSLFAFAAFGASAQTSPIELGGFTLGAPMAACPADFESKTTGVVTVCTSATQLIGGQSVEQFTLSLFEGKINRMGAKRIAAPQDVVANFGKPSETNGGRMLRWKADAYDAIFMPGNANLANHLSIGVPGNAMYQAQQAYKAATLPAVYELKGYALGAELTAAPKGFRTKTDGAMITYESDTETLAGKPVKAFVISTYQGKIASVGAAGFDRPTEVANAIKLKFGEPNASMSKPHIQEYTWAKGGDSVMIVKAYSSNTSMVMLKDMKLSTAAQDVNAAAAQSDI
ncbi:hypothetical protein QTI24_28445 [Variovorax sp. J22P240]|uniref:hypothetical protein n=1 Tax=Variovorax sp. J22P240 TaxID=3053514 RepID=UPI002578C671|nr:hypothetical protein [Variovorax sp. J22P240]MDM0002563.1 hypothetical protein [Variovorax sp. J22P240]